MIFTIYGKENCSFCKRAVNLCKRKSLDYNYFSLVEEVTDGDSEITKEQLEHKLGKAVRTVPQIIVERGGKVEYVGGFEEMNAFVRENA